MIPGTAQSHPAILGGASQRTNTRWDSGTERWKDLDPITEPLN